MAFKLFPCSKPCWWSEFREIFYWKGLVFRELDWGFFFFFCVSKINLKFSRALITKERNKPATTSFLELNQIFLEDCKSWLETIHISPFLVMALAQSVWLLCQFPTGLLLSDLVLAAVLSPLHLCPVTLLFPFMSSPRVIISWEINFRANVAKSSWFFILL